ncbi:MAG: hypothetical protein LBU32_11715 [Clostridiales bacterium]|nr:hypothetical protein [Clostridiales bacterium]
MLTTIDQKTLAYVNLYAVLGCLENLCELVEEAGSLIKKDKVSIGFAVKDGPQATLSFNNGKCVFSEGAQECDIRLPFGTCRRFNGLIAGTVKPLPSKGFTKVFFLINKFSFLTDILSHNLKPDPLYLVNPETSRTNALLLLYTAASAASQVANYDRSGIFSANQMPDGDIAVNISGEAGATIQVREHRLTTIKKPCEKPRAVMEFKDADTAGRLLRGELSGMAAICEGSVRMRGMVNMIDNLNRILDRVNYYLN